MVMPGDNITMDVELITPIAMEEQLRSRSAKVAEQSALALLRKFKSNHNPTWPV